MALNKNVFYATNPARMADALWYVMGAGGVDISDMLIFLPSRRAVRTVEKMIAQKLGGACILPTLVALGEAADEDDSDIDSPDAVSNMARVIMTSRILIEDKKNSINTYATALPIAHDLVRMWDYMENEGVNPATINWVTLVDEKYAEHFQGKAQILNILSSVMPNIFPDRPTVAAVRNRDIRAWRDKLNNYSRVIVCASTASVPATADLMVAVANADNGCIILSGKIAGCVDDFSLDTNPYNSEYKFLSRIGITPDDIIPINVGPSAIDFLNVAFGNSGVVPDNGAAVEHCHLIECERESQEAAAVAEIASRAAMENKSVLVITPDAAGNQRIAAALAARGITADFSSGVPGTMTNVGRGILNWFDDKIDSGKGDDFNRLYMAADFDLMEMLVRLIDSQTTDFAPTFDVSDALAMPIWNAIRELSDCLKMAGIHPDISDVRTFLADAIGGVSVRGQMDENATVTVLGTIESRMQTADVVILTGLNDGMFPARGYENAWLPRAVTDGIGLPSADRKVSLQSLDFMNLSCGGCVYWVRSIMSGGVPTTESRLLSRVRARRGAFDTVAAADILSAVRQMDVHASNPLDYTPPAPAALKRDIYVTQLEKLIHNPYVYYVEQVLRLEKRNDYWVGVDARSFGTLIHATIQNARDFSDARALYNDMDNRARIELKSERGILYQFWTHRFAEIAPVISARFSELLQTRGMGNPEIRGAVTIAGRRICAKADRVWDGLVMDVKTGAAPEKRALERGEKLQLPIEAFILQSGGFGIRTTEKSSAPEMEFLQLKKSSVKSIVYDAATTQNMIDAAIARAVDVIEKYSVDGARYEYNPRDGFFAYSDFLRCDD